MGNNSVPKFIFRLSRFPVYRGSVLGRFYCIMRVIGWGGHAARMENRRVVCRGFAEENWGGGGHLEKPDVNEWVICNVSSSSSTEKYRLD